MAIEDLGFAWELGAVGEAVPDVAVLSDQAQGLLFTATTDEDRNVARRCRIELGEPRVDPRKRLAEVVEPATRGTEFVAVFVVVLLLPARSDAKDESAVADVVNSARHIGEQLGVAVRVTGNQRTDFQPRRLLRPRAEHRPAFVVRTVGVAV